MQSPLTDPGSMPLTGLTAAEAQARLARDGYNELPGSAPRSAWRIALAVLKEPMFILLVSCATLYLVLGDLEGGIMLLLFVFVVFGITLYQERKTERALDALRGLASPRALVIRDGAELRIPGREVVVGDLMVLREGDRVPADVVLRSSLNLSVDESMLTGESMAVDKDASATEEEGRLLYSGTLVVGGMGMAEALATGRDTRVGAIGKAMAATEQGKTPLQQEMGRIVRNMSILALVACVMVAVAFYLVRGGWLESLLSGLSLAMAMMPEEFPVVFTVFTALGAWRISKREVLTTRSSAIETLGAATMLCTDKTGTLTQNRMVVRCLDAGGQRLQLDPQSDQEIPEEFHILVEYGILASQTDPFDPMERAIKALGEHKLAGTEHLHGDWRLIREFPLSKELLAMSRAFEQPGSDLRMVAAKGAPEAIFDLCHLSGQEVARHTEAIRAIASDGLRVIAVARSQVPAHGLPDLQHDFDFEFCGLIGLADPVRPEAAAAVAECRGAGIEVAMITGDYPETALSIARQVGLSTQAGVLTGSEMAGLDDAALQARLGAVRIFARISPEQKLRLVQAFQALGHVVAMTGDGVNDAPALKAAHIGVAMGRKGTDVAREAADLVLLDDNFASIVAAVRLGRRIYDNIQKAFSYIVTVHLPIAGLAFFPVMLGAMPLLLMPVHIALLELMIDPACSVALESVAEEPDIMRRRPRRRDHKFLGGGRLFVSVFNGVVTLLLLLGVFAYAWRSGLDDAQSRTVAFLSLLGCNVALILTSMSMRQGVGAILLHLNKATAWLLVGVAGLVALILSVPFLRSLFQLELFPWGYAWLPLAAPLALLVVLETVKALVRGRSA